MTHLVLLLLGACSLDGGGCASIFGPEGVSVAFLVPDEGDYAWSIVGEEEEMSCTATIPGDGSFDCGDESFAFSGPDAVEGGGWRFGTTLWTSGDVSVHVELSSGDATLLDTDFAPDWQPVEDEGNCAEHLSATQEFDVRDEADTGA